MLIKFLLIVVSKSEIFCITARAFISHSIHLVSAIIIYFLDYDLKHRITPATGNLTGVSLLPCKNVVVFLQLDSGRACDVKMAKVDKSDFPCSYPPQNEKAYAPVLRSLLLIEVFCPYD